ncbi:hypothetical protein AMTRI_Chr11g158790 [Amborella trichopoda]|uniref:ZF-HD dimerization-type domain-containing protein n=1 Tax=Amborella trichopoda TaxID=13333 RepID=W1NVZ6_AMBTC|nr:zinc-finger homeodomain protein 2 [Amborella trichopoda]XP_020519091.1 zinc-finger homeodomain protein 2 [Amborella trichopoda]ERM99777.1 hypothetical protein AMTR_s00099p00145100 [Amborella trichopoda]|eukprot:XP_011621016.1 zinc-finger homeodomain protein 2 [Amborella trichopoda]
MDESMPIPITTTYTPSAHHLIHDSPPPPNHHQIIPSTNGPQTLEREREDLHSYKKNSTPKYRECLRNHAASMGGNATDGCGEFMAAGPEGTPESLKCSVCNCHRNFHRKETEGEDTPSPCESCFLLKSRKKSGLLISTGPETYGYPTPPLVQRPPPAMATPPMMVSYNLGPPHNHHHHHHQPSESDEHEERENSFRAPLMVKKRFRTKFTQEQKEKMLSFAEKVGWRIQKQEEGVVQQFCQEIGVKRRVLKVWMHNNKHNLAKKASS